MKRVFFEKWIWSFKTLNSTFIHNPIYFNIKLESFEFIFLRNLNYAQSSEAVYESICMKIYLQ